MFVIGPTGILYAFPIQVKKIIIQVFKLQHNESILNTKTEVILNYNSDFTEEKVLTE